MKFVSKWAVVLLLFFASACSKDKGSDGAASRRSDAPCNALPLGQDQLDAALLRRVVECLNSGGELNGIAALLDATSDEALNAVAAHAQKYFIDRPERLYALDRRFNERQPEGPRSLMGQMTILMSDEEALNDGLSLIQKMDIRPWIDVSDKYTRDDLYSVLKSTRKLLSSVYTTDTLFHDELNWRSDELISLLIEVLSEDRYDFINNLRGLIVEDHILEDVAKIAELPLQKRKLNAGDWKKLNEFSDLGLQALQDGRLLLFRDALVRLEDPLKCFRGTANLSNMDKFVLSELGKAKDFSDLSVLLFASKPFCEVPEILKNALRVMFDLERRPAWPRIRDDLSALMDKPRVLSLLKAPEISIAEPYLKGMGLPELRQLMGATLLLEDASDLKSIAREVGKFSTEEIVGLLRTLRPFETEDYKAADRFLKYFMRDENEKGLATIDFALETWDGSDEDFGLAIASEALDSMRENEAFYAAVEGILKAPELKGAVVNIAKLSLNGTFDEIMMRVSQMLSTLIESGSHDFEIRQVSLPEVEGNRLEVSPIRETFPAIVPLAKNACSGIDLDFDWTVYSPRNAKFETLKACLIGDGFPKGAEWVTRLAETPSPNGTPYLYRFYPFVNTLLSWVEAAGANAKNRVKLLLNIAEAGTDILVKEAPRLRNLQRSWMKVYAVLKKQPAFNNLLNLGVEASSWRELYQLAAIGLRSPPAGMPVHFRKEESLYQEMLGRSLIRYGTVNDAKEKSLGGAEAIRHLFNYYCKDLNPETDDCRVHPDHVALYKSAGAAGFLRQMVREYWASSNSWLPREVNWEISPDPNALPTRVGNLRYHTNPLFHLIHNQPDGVLGLLNGALSFVNFPEKEQNHILLGQAHNRVIIPYFPMNPKFNYATPGGQELERRIKFRLVNGYDQLEILAVMAGFRTDILGKTLGDFLGEAGLEDVQNIGHLVMGEWALAWGDVDLSTVKPEIRNAVMRAKPEGRCPDKGPGDAGGNKCIRSLKQILAMIDKHMKKFGGFGDPLNDRCDPKSEIRFLGFGTGITGNVIPEFCDIHRRVYNVRMVSKSFDSETPERHGGYGMLAYLRNIFIELYIATPPSRREDYGYGMRLDPVCLTSPKGGPKSKCQLTLLDIIFRITRSGLLHHNAMANEKEFFDSSQLIPTLRRMVKDQKNTKRLAKWLSSTEGLVTLDKIMTHMVNFSKTSSDDQVEAIANSMDAIFGMGYKITDENFSQLFGQVVTAAETTRAPWINAMPTMLNLLGMDQVAKLVRVSEASYGPMNTVIPRVKDKTFLNDLLTLAPVFATQEATVKEMIRDAGSLSLTPAQKKDLIPVVDDLASESGAGTRNQLHQNIRDGGLTAGLDALSDPAMMDLTLDAMTQAQKEGRLDRFIDRGKRAFQIK